MTDTEALNQISLQLGLLLSWAEALAFAVSFLGGLYCWRLVVVFKNQRHFW